MRTKFNGILTLFLALVVQISFAQDRTISGTVSDESGPLPGVTILKKGTTQGTETDFDGNYSISAKTGDVLVFSFVGMKTAERTVGTSNQVSVVLEGDNLLEEVVVVGYGNVQDKKLVQNVTRIKNEDIRDIPATTAQELLQGQSSGVQFVQSSGVLGAASVIKIRGVGSLTAGAQPLIVVDGIPLSDNDNTFTNGGNTGLNPLQDINPEDIETFSVLKDAAASAIYGSRGANGVILITTKKGKKGQQTKIDLNVYTSISEATDVIPMMSADQYRGYLNQRFGVPVTDLPQGEFDWVDGVTRSGVSQNYNVSIAGANENTSYFMSVGHRDQDGFIIGNSLTRSNVRVNLDHQSRDWLKTGINMTYSVTDNNRIDTENSINAPLTTAYLMRPWVQPRDANGNFVNTGFPQNVIGLETVETDKVTSNRIIGSTYAQINLSDNFYYKAELGIDRVDVQSFIRTPELFSPNPPDPGGSAAFLKVIDNKWLTNHTLNYNTTLADKHNISALAGLSYESSVSETVQVAGNGFLSDKLRNVSSAGEKTQTEQNRTRWGLYGLFSRLSYDYDGKYILEGTLRRDGSSRFGANERFGTFWSVAGGWVISDEAFMQNVNFINNLKLTASYGTVGNDRIGNFGSLGLFGSLGYNNTPGLQPIQPSNPDLKWETSKTYDIGISTDLFNNRLSLKANYFNKKTEDLLLNIPLPWTTGFNSYTANAGTMENKGWEFSINSKNISTDNFSWSTSLNLSFIENKILSLPDAAQSSEGRFVAGSPVQRAIVGHSANNFYLVRYVGINSQTGDAEWLTKDGQITSTPNFDTDRVIAGDANPDFYGGITNTFKYKGFDLNVLMSFSYGNDIYIDGLRFTDAPTISGSYNQSVRLLDYWKQPGDNAYAPALGSSTENSFRQNSTLQLKDGSFLRMRNITLGYNLPRKYLENSFLSSFRIYATANNLFTIKADDLDGFDPEVTDSTNPLSQGETFFTAPQSKTYLIGARISF